MRNLKLGGQVERAVCAIYKKTFYIRLKIYLFIKKKRKFQMYTYDLQCMEIKQMQSSRLGGPKRRERSCWRTARCGSS